MSAYTTTVPCFAQMLNALKGLLAKGQAHASALAYDLQSLLDSRLAPDMHALATQVRRPGRHRKTLRKSACRCEML